MQESLLAVDESRYWLDGVPTNEVPAGNRGLAFGDGVFRTLLVSAGRPVWIERHLAVLARDAHRLGLDSPDRVLHEDILAAARAATGPFAALRVTLWRQAAGRGYAPVGRATRRLVGLTPYHPPADAVWTLGVSRHRAWPEPFPGVKHLNRLLSVAAAGEALDQQVPEVLIRGGGMTGPWAWVGGGRSTLYLVAPHQARLYIPSTRRHGIEGAGLGWLTDWAQRAGLRIRRPTRLPMPGPDDEFGLINSLLGPRGIGAIRDMEPRTIWTAGPRGPGPGPVIGRMQADFSHETGTPPLAGSNTLACASRGAAGPDGSLQGLRARRGSTQA